MRMSFSKDFVWGAATSSYQIEGAAFEDGKGLSVWDVCCQASRFVKNGDNGEVACDHYHRYKEDVQIMKEIGLQAYRMAISWPRVMPEGEKVVNEKGLAFYDRLVDELLKNGITPYITLFHWDYPYDLYKKGGWLNSQSADWFAEYTRVIVKRLSDRVTHWITLNEPQCFVGLGHHSGIHAPGLKLGLKDVLEVWRNSLLAHGKSAQTIRAFSKKSCEIGYAPVAYAVSPRTGTTNDIDAARAQMFAIENTGMENNTWWMDPVYLGVLPEDGLKIYEPWLPDFKQDDLKIINQPLDFQSVNIYFGSKAGGEDSSINETKKPTGYPHTDMKWEVTPDALYWGPKFLFERYKKPVLITENGMANIDWVSIDGNVHDPQRIDYLYRYLRAYKKAANDGVALKGYFCWSLMDNFEWAEGYNMRFGLTYIDYATQRRIIKDSGYWYRSVIESNGGIIK